MRPGQSHADLPQRKEKAEGKVASASVENHLLPKAFSDARVAKPALLSLRRGEIINLLPGRSKNPRDDHLGDSISIPDRERPLVKVDQENTDLAPVIGVDGPGTVDDANAIPNGQTAARPDLTFKPLRNRDGNPGGNKPPLPWG